MEVVVGEAIVELEEVDAGDVVVLLDVAGLVVPVVVEVTTTLVGTGSAVDGTAVSAPPQALAMTATVGRIRRRGFMMNATYRPRRT